MKILSASQTRFLDSETIKKQEITSFDLMQRAGQRLANEIVRKFSEAYRLMIFCGTGNNGGDGIVMAETLLSKNYDLDVYVINSNHKSDNFIKIEKQFSRFSGFYHTINSEADIPEIPKNKVVVDAIFGSGLNREIDGVAASVIDKINNSGVKVVSIDIASGLGDGIDNVFKAKHCIKPTFSFAIQAPFLSQLNPENAENIGILEIVDISLDRETHSNCDTNYSFVEYLDIVKMVKFRNKFAHKGNFGHVLLIAGSYGKAGAAVLAAKACLKSGAGLLTVHLPKKCLDVLQVAVSEAMCEPDCDDFVNAQQDIDLSKYNVVAIGPGLGTDVKTSLMLKNVLINAKKLNIKTVLDADALNLIAKDKNLLQFVPENAIFTPHPGEFFRLTGTKNNFDVLRNYCIDNKIVTVLKGAYTAVCNSNGKISFNSTGNPGMATAGSGDSLTGIIAAMLAQGFQPYQAAMFGVYTHGMAGDYAARELGETSIVASDIINNLSDVFKNLTDNYNY